MGKQEFNPLQRHSRKEKLVLG